MNSLINGTDDRIAFAVNSIIQYYLIHTGFRRIHCKFIQGDMPNFDSFDLPGVSKSYFTPDSKC
jgi:hypothetical protein